jgi:hypothetical protein
MHLVGKNSSISDSSPSPASSSVNVLASNILSLALNTAAFTRLFPQSIHRFTDMFDYFLGVLQPKIIKNIFKL